MQETAISLDEKDEIEKTPHKLEKNTDSMSKKSVFTLQCRKKTSTSNKPINHNVEQTKLKRKKRKTKSNINFLKLGVMKTKNLFLGMVAGLFMVACANENDPVVDNSQDNANEYAFIKVNIKDGGTFSRSADGFDEGVKAERTVTDATFYFFDADGNAFNVVGNNNYVVKEVGDMGEHTESTGNVSDKYSPILVINKGTGEMPVSMVAVINAPASLKTSMGLTALKAKVDDYRMNGETFIMSNSVYAADGKQVDATYIPRTSIATSQEEAEAKPIDVYVERVAAKITLNVNKDNKYLVGEEEGIYAQVTGWELYNGTESSKLIKSIDPTWPADLLSISWNDASNFRSYWASSEGETFGGGFYKWNELDNGVGAPAYYNEFTTTTPNLIVKVEFMNAEDENLVIAEWLGERYTVDDLKTNMANMMKNEIFVGVEGESAVSISAADLELVQRSANDPTEYVNGENNYDVLPVAITPAEGNSYFDKNKNSLTVGQVNEMLKASVPTAAIWQEGGYYVIPIDHFGKKGIVRNHSYVIEVEDIVGLGTPVYDPEQLIWDEDFESKEAYIAARINILSWKIVSQSVTLE